MARTETQTFKLKVWYFTDCTIRAINLKERNHRQW